MSDDDLDPLTIIEQAMRGGHAHWSRDRDSLTCIECGQPPHLHLVHCPVLDTPVAVDTVQPRATAIEMWLFWTGGRRALVIHNGTFGDGDHDLTETTAGCHCNPETIPARAPGVLHV